MKKRIILKGKTPQNQGVVIRAEGEYEADKKAFLCKQWTYERLPQKEVFEAYAKTFKGIGAKKATQLYEEFGADYNIFSNRELMKEKFPKNFEKIVQKAEKDSQFIIDTQLVSLLASFGVIKPNKITKICKSITLKDFLKDPFCLMDVPGVHISFKTCNSIVLQMQQKEPKYLKSETRVKLGVEFTLKKMLSRGHTYILAQKLLQATTKTLNEGVIKKRDYVNDDLVKKQINLLHKTHKIKAEKSLDELRIYDAFYYDCENFIAEELYRKLHTRKRQVPQEKIQSLLDEFDENAPFELADSQRLAVETMVNNEIAIITGSAGTGKTTVLQAAIFVLEKLGRDKIVLAAPTGRAARRMAEATSREASTIHSLLHLGIEDENTDAVDIYMGDEKISADAIFIDETSMCDIGIIYRLFQKINSDTQIFFIGDPNQLESVGSGNVLSDMIASHRVPVVKLQFIYRQAKDSNIIMNADRILNGNQRLTVGDDFQIIDMSEPKQIAYEIAKIYCEEYKKINDIFNVQCICPARKEGMLASNQLNKIVQKTINPIARSNTSNCFKANGFTFYLNDKVICSKNTKTVRNGDIGIVTGVTPSTLQCYFDTGEEVFNVEDATELGISLAYCITVHKSQGDEFAVTIMPITEENQNMLKRNLFYTAVTRAKNKMILVGDVTQISKAIYNNKAIVRNGRLLQRIKKKFNQEKIT